jgi:hypothetical protein
MTVQPFGTRITWTEGNILINQTVSALQWRDLNIPMQKAVQKHATVDTFWTMTFTILRFTEHHTMQWLQSLPGTEQLLMTHQLVYVVYSKVIP